MSSDPPAAPEGVRAEPFRPRGAVFISTAGPDLFHAARRIAAELNNAGVAVFLDEVTSLAGEEGEAQVLRALKSADQVLVLLTPTTGPALLPESGRGSSGVFDRRYVWLAIGAASARGIRIVGLLDQIRRDELLKNPSIPNIVKRGALRESQWQYVRELQAIDNSRQHPTGAGTTVRLCCAARDLERVRQICQHLVESYRLDASVVCWDAGHSHDGSLTDAVAVFFGRDGFPAWNQGDFLAMLGDYEGSKRPIVLVSLPEHEGTPTVPEDLRGSAVWIDCRPTGDVLYLQFLWAVSGYRMDNRSAPVGTGRRIVLRLALHGYAERARELGTAGDNQTIAELQELIQDEIDRGLDACSLRRERSVAVETEDGAILLFDSVEQMHGLAAHAAVLGKDRPDLRFRMGAATGSVSLEVRPSGGLGLLGAPVADAIRLEAAGAPCALTVDSETYGLLPPFLSPAYREEVRVPGPQRQVLKARRCVFVEGIAPPGPARRRPRPRRPPDRRQVQESLYALFPETVLDALMFLLEMPVEQQPSRYISHEDRCNGVLNWAVSRGGPGLKMLADELRYLRDRRDRGP